ncbi:hypothetical protein FraQA3DRAFT_1879 [Frankia sp. QA3]|nr:hypothetical protein FraQA3DRAFT_1879 [Frankia sp. QA3]
MAALAPLLGAARGALGVPEEYGRLLFGLEDPVLTML